MTPEVAAILGLFFWLWSHEARHAYDEHGRRLSMLIYAVGSVLAAVLMLWALIAAVTS